MAQHLLRLFQVIQHRIGNQAVMEFAVFDHICVLHGIQKQLLLRPLAARLFGDHGLRIVQIFPIGRQLNGMRGFVIHIAEPFGGIAAQQGVADHLAAVFLLHMRDQRLQIRASRPAPANVRRLLGKILVGIRRIPVFFQKPGPRIQMEVQHEVSLRRVLNKEIQLPVHRAEIVSILSQPGFAPDRIGHAVGGAKTRGDDVKDPHAGSVKILYVKILRPEGFEGHRVHNLSIHLDLAAPIPLYNMRFHEFFLLRNVRNMHANDALSAL